MRARIRPILCIAAVLLTVAGILVCASLIWIQSNWALEWVQSRINPLIPGTLTIEGHRLSPLKAALEIHGVELLDPHGAALAGFARFYAQLDWRALLKREIRLSAVQLDRPWADLRVDESGGLNLLTAVVPPGREAQTGAVSEKDSPPFNVVLESFHLNEGRFTLTPADPATRLEINGIALAADGDLQTRRGSLHLTLAEIHFSSANIRPQPTRIVLEAHLDGDHLHLPQLSATSGPTMVTISASAGDLSTTPRLNGTLAIDSQLTELQSIFNLGPGFSGPVRARLTLDGTAANPDLELTLALEDGHIAGQPVDRGDLSVQLRDRELSIDHAAFHLAGGAAILKGRIDLRGAFPTGFLTPPQDLNAIAYDLTLEQQIPELKPWLEPLAAISGSLTGRATATGRGVMPSDLSVGLTLDGSLRRLLAAGMDRAVDGEVRLAAQIDQGRIWLQRFTVAADGLELSADGRFGMHDRTLAGSLSASAQDLSRILALVGVSSLQGACTAALSVDGSLNQPQFSLNVTASDLAFDAYSLGNLSLDAVMDHSGRIDLNDVNLQNQGSRIHGDGRLRLLPDGKGIDVDFDNTVRLTLETVSAADFMATPPLDGTLDGHLRVNGPLGLLQGELILDGSRIALTGMTLGDIGARMRLKDGALHVDRLDLRNQHSRLTATGRVELLAPGTHRLIADPRVDLSIDSDHFDPGDFIDDISGAFTLTGMLTGSVENPRGRVSLTAKRASLAGQQVARLLLEARFQERRLWLDRFVATLAPGEEITGGGWVGLDRTIDLHLQSDGITTPHISRLDEFFPGQGSLRFGVTAQGRMDNPDAQGHLTISDMRIHDEALSDVHLTVTLDDMRARVTGNLNFEVDAHYDLRGGDFDLRLLFDRTQTAAYWKAAGIPDLNATLTGRVQAAGNIGDPANASVNLDLTALDLHFKETRLLHSDRISLQLNHRQLAISEFEVAVLSAGSLRLTGDVTADGRVNLAVDGSIPLAAAAPFSDELADATGLVHITAAASGDVADPQISARIDLEAIGMTVPGLVQRLDDLNGRIHLTTDTVHIETVKGMLDTGSFSLSGTVRHEQLALQRVDLALTARSLPLSIPDTLELLLNGDLAISGDRHAMDARGELMLLEGLYYRDVNISLLQMATTRQRAVAPPSQPLSIPWVDRINLDISVGHRQPFLVHNNLAYLEISPDLRVGGTLDNPIVSGRAQVRSGSVTFQRKTFDVKRGVIDFVNPYRTEAAIDIESETTVRAWTIRLAIKGTPDNLDLQLSSVPQESDSDILALILFGRTGRELAGGSTGTQRTTGQIMAEMIADTFGADLKRTTGIDILEVDANGDGEGAEGIQVTVGKRLSDRMTVKYSVGSRDSGEVVQRAITEYKLLENILVSGFQDSRGIYGSEMVFRIEFR